MNAVTDRGHWQPTVAPTGVAVFVFLLAILAWASVPLGSNRPWSMALLAALLLGLTFVVAIARLWQLAPWPHAHEACRLPIVLLSAWAGYSLLQAVPVPMTLVRILSPAAHEIWSITGLEGMATLSLDRGATLARGLHLASLAALFALTVAVLSNWRRVQCGVVFVVALGTVQSILGMSVALGQNYGLLAAGAIEGVGGISGTFVNPNHFAGFVEMAFCVSVGLGFGHAAPGVSLAGARQFLGSASAWALSSRLPLLIAQGVMIVALFWSGSRGALLALVVAIATTFLAWFPVQRISSAGSRIGAFGSVVLVSVLVLIWGGPGVVADKFANSGFSGNRLALAQATAAMGADFALTGSGAGSFKSVFPSYKRTALGWREYEHAHNDYLEFFAEGGVIGLSLFLGGLGVAMLRTVRLARQRQGRASRALSAGCVAACLSLLVHGLVDFNLQIPANATLFVFILAMGLAAATVPRSQG
ncbi:MAG: putative inorganic carbon (HCO3(-)) transporter [Gammaproteobacteria bacterium]